jgi:hypothetical protein
MLFIVCIQHFDEQRTTTHVIPLGMDKIIVHCSAVLKAAMIDTEEGTSLIFFTYVQITPTVKWFQILHAGSIFLLMTLCKNISRTPTPVICRTLRSVQKSNPQTAGACGQPAEGCPAQACFFSLLHACGHADTFPFQQEVDRAA